MSSRALEVRVGAVVVVAVVIAVVGTMWFQKFQIAEKRYSFYVRFPEVGGLVKSDPIYVNGVERGRVDGISLLSGSVVVTMGVRDGVSIPKDSKIELKSVGIMGERFVAIREGTSPQAIAPGDTLTGTFLMGLSELMGSAGEILDDVHATSKTLREIAEALSGNGKLQQGVTDLAAAGKNLRGMTEDNRARLEKTIAHFQRSSALLDSLVSGHYAQLDSSLTAISRAGGDAETTARNLAAVSADLKVITARLRAGDGTAGRLLTDDQLINRMESTVTQLDSLITDIRSHPGRYVKFSLF